MIKCLTKITDPDKKFCFRCGRPMEYPHDDQYRIEYDIDTGRALMQKYKIRTQDLQYCTRDNVYIAKKKDGNWRRGYDLLEILHLIA